MSTPIIIVENLGKRYRLDHQADRQRYTTLRDVITEKGRRILRHVIAAGSALPNRTKATSEDFWALKNVSFEIQQGDVVGIIGRNGAGKSTLLKILSRITEPTAGSIRIRGRVASLLEVGTGFHPELTGRENIFLNGAILGMSNSEIKRKFDEIVAFAEVERFLDTPVKRYSSGMYVRLAFAVAAHLEPEILIVDEVLAVGDSDFQKKCLGKMGEMSKGGRTVLFVSHNLAAIKSLTKRGLHFNDGQLVYAGETVPAIQSYIELLNKANPTDSRQLRGTGVHTAIRAARLVAQGGGASAVYEPGTPFHIEIEMETDGKPGLSLELFIVDASRSRIAMASTYQFHGEFLPSSPGLYLCTVELQPLWLASGTYSIDVAASVVNVTFDHYVESAAEFQVLFSNPLGRELDFKHSYGFGALALLLSVPVRFEKRTTSNETPNSLDSTLSRL